jgi:hypothetical protein
MTYQKSNSGMKSQGDKIVQVECFWQDVMIVKGEIICKETTTTIYFSQRQHYKTEMLQVIILKRNQADRCTKYVLLSRVSHWETQILKKLECCKTTYMYWTNSLQEFIVQSGALWLYDLPTNHEFSVMVMIIIWEILLHLSLFWLKSFVFHYADCISMPW